MSFEPQKYYLNILEFFSVLLPGSIVTYIFQDRLLPIVGYKLTGTMDLEYGIVFLLTAYVVGHTVFLIGSQLDLIDQWLRSYQPDGIAKRLSQKKKLPSSWMRWISDRIGYDHRLIRRVSQIKDEMITQEPIEITINAFQWAKSYLQMYHSHVLTDVERFESNSKFFRGMVITVICMWIHALIVGNYGQSSVLFLLIWPIFYRYITQREKSIRQTLWNIIILERSMAKKEPYQQFKRIPQSGGVVYRVVNGSTQFLLVTSMSDPESWVCPKGHVEFSESLHQAAIREVYEESGVWAKPYDHLMDVEYSKSGKEYICTYYLMEHLETPSRPEKGRSLAWVALNEVHRYKMDKKIKALLKRASLVLDR